MAQQIQGCGGASDYGMYIWGINQTAGQGNVIQPAHLPLRSGGKKKKTKGGMSSTLSPVSNVSPMLQNTLQSSINMMSPNYMQNITSNQINAMTSTESIVHTNTPYQAGGKRRQKKISYKHKKRNGRRKRTAKKIH
jgi:hypothetical protein